MQSLLRIIPFLFLHVACNTNAAVKTNNDSFAITIPKTITVALKQYNPGNDTVPASTSDTYSLLEYEKKEQLNAAPGTKSVLFNRDGSKLYAMNLEGMSVYEFDQPTRKVIKEFKFKPTKGKGWDYENDKSIPSYEEKPVEACLSHDDKILWVSLHNAEGIVPIRLDSLNSTQPSTNKKLSKKITVVYRESPQKDSFYVPLIKTGKTPKIISRTADSKYLLVSNWHSYNVSVLETNINEYPYAKVVSTIPVASIPRGIVVDDKTNRSYVAIMGGATISVISNAVWMKETDIAVASNPRHIVMDTSGHIFVSYNKLGKIACIDAETGNTLFKASTAAKPRTIILSKNYKFLFATCYSSDTVEVFKINDNGFSKVISLPCKGHPVGVDIFEDNTKLEAWVCSYNSGSISIFSFNKKP
ncbi:MAG: YncE family protein [Chitinophagaceae bacterium]